MPVDLSVPNSVINAYLQGLSIRRSREQQEIENEQRKKQFDESVRQFDEQAAAEKANRDVVNKYHEAQLNLSEGRVKPPAELYTRPKEVPELLLRPGLEQEEPQPPTEVPFVNPIGGQTETLKPVYPSERIDLELSKVLKALNITHPKELEKLKLREDAETAKLLFTQDQQNRRAELSAKTRLQAARSRQSNDILPPDQVSQLGLPYGTTRQQAAQLKIHPQRPLSPAQQAKFNSLVSLRNKLSEIYSLGEKTGFAAHIPVVGNLDARLKASFPGKSSEDLISYRNKLGGITAEQLNQLYGSVLSTGELRRATQFIPDFSNDPKVAEGRIKSSIDAIESLLSEVTSPEIVRPNNPANTPEWLRIAPKKNKKGTSLNVEESIVAGKPIYGVK